MFTSSAWADPFASNRAPFAARRLLYAIRLPGSCRTSPLSRNIMQKRRLGNLSSRIAYALTSNARCWYNPKWTIKSIRFRQAIHYGRFRCRAIKTAKAAILLCAAPGRGRRALRRRGNPATIPRRSRHRSSPTGTVSTAGANNSTRLALQAIVISIPADFLGFPAGGGIPEPPPVSSGLDDQEAFVDLVVKPAT